MRHLLLGLTLLMTAGDRTANRDALLAADRALSDKTASLGMVQGFVPVLDHGAAYLYPGAPLLRGSDHIRSFLESTDSIVQQTWAPVFADVSADGRLGYSYGWTRSSGARGKYLACWQKTHEACRLADFASSRSVPVPDSVALPPPQPGNGTLSAQVRGRADSRELMQTDSSFAALSAASGAKTAFLAFAAEDAISFGGGAQLTAGRKAIAAGFGGFPAGGRGAGGAVAARILPSGGLVVPAGGGRVFPLHHSREESTRWPR